jgi:hypothetical protein
MVLERESTQRYEVPAAPSQNIGEVLNLVKASTSVELKVTVPDTSHRAAIRGLGFDPVEAQPRQVYFFDTPDLALNRTGIIVRARRIQGGRGDTVVKLRPVDPATINKRVRRSEGFKIELDAMPTGYVCSASFKGLCTAQETLDVAAGDARLSSLFSEEQRAFYDAHAPADIEMSSLVPLGPVFLLRVRYSPNGFSRRITVEMWLYPDGSRIFEISTKCLPEECFQIAAELRAHLAQCGVEVSAVQEAKTRRALEFFSADYREGR